MRCSIPVSIAIVAVACVAGAPPTRSPLRERLASADTSSVEDAARACLEKTGWKVDPVGSVSAGSNVVHATKAQDITAIYVHVRDVKPRVTGGPDDGDPFWPCLSSQLGASGAAPAASEAVQE